MNFFKYILLSSLFVSSAFAYVDSDIDGVDDSVDLCLNTPFDALADADGCAPGQKNHSKLTLKIGSDISFNKLSNNSTNFNFFANYNYNNFDFSLSSSNYTSYDNSSGGSSEAGDLYLSSGYIFKNEKSNTKLSLGMKLATADKDVGTGENDYFASIYFDYFINEKQDIFLYYGYTVSGDSVESDYENFSSFSIGSGIALTNSWYSGISYDYSGSNFADTVAYKAVSWFNSYAFSKKYFMTLNYAHGLDDLSYDHTFSLKFGVHFE